ncbi:MAG: PilZ domain-containing protein [Planctomycetes bacterium]|nr:PilZ domain-containing protein [Planctomycetota bacterium]
MAERRRLPRFAAQSMAVEFREHSVLRFLARGASPLGTILNISEEGLQFVAPRSPRQDRRLDLTIRILGETEPIRVAGDIAWAANSEGTGPVRVGVKFRNSDTRVRKRLQVLSLQGRLVEIREEPVRATERRVKKDG